MLSSSVDQVEGQFRGLGNIETSFQCQRQGQTSFCGILCIWKTSRDETMRFYGSYDDFLVLCSGMDIQANTSESASSWLHG